MKKVLVKFLFALVLLTATGMTTVQAQNYERLSAIEDERFGNYAIVNTTDYVTIKNLRRYWVQTAQRMHKQHRDVQYVLTGSNEAVLKVTIPARLLFAPNDSTLLRSSDRVLRPFLPLLQGKEAVASLVVGGYMDNNGSEQYLNHLSAVRARTVRNWFGQLGVGPADLRCFGFGNSVPLNDNSTLALREKNRRISLFFVPNKRMIRMAKKGEL